MLPRINNSSWTTYCLYKGRKLFAIISHTKPYTDKPGNFWGTLILIDEKGVDQLKTTFDNYKDLRRAKTEIKKIGSV